MRFPRSKILTLLAVALGAVFIAGCQSPSRDYTPHITRFYLEESSHLPASHITEMILPVSGSHITVQSKPVYAEWDIASVTSYETEFGPAIVLLFRPEAAAAFYRTTINNQGKRLVVTINGVPLGAYYIKAPVEDGRIMFYLEIPDEEIPEVVRSIQKTSDEIKEEADKSPGW